MKALSHILLSTAVLALVACSEEKQETTATTTPAATTVPQATQTTGQAADNAVPVSTAALNPAHGQPNHRCDIPVGTPLSAPAQPNLTMQPTIAPPTPKVKGAVASGVNPPHGELGHDCSIPVGAPLNQ